MRTPNAMRFYNIFLTAFVPKQANSGFSCVVDRGHITTMYPHKKLCEENFIAQPLSPSLNLAITRYQNLSLSKKLTISVLHTN